MAAQQQQQSQGGDNSLAPLWITMLVFIAGYMIWYFAHPYIVRFVFAIKLAEAHLVSLFIHTLKPTIQYMQTVDPAQVSFKELAAVSTAIGNYIRFPIIIILIVLAVWVYVKNPILRFRSTYTMDSLANEESKNWPQIRPVIGKDLVDQDIDEGPWAMAMTPKLFAKKYKLLSKVEVEPDENVLLARTETKVSVNRGTAQKVFAMQLGAYWHGVDSLSKPLKAIFAMFAARINRDRTAAERLITQIAASTEYKTLDFSAVNAVLDKYKDTSAVQKVVGRHAYVTTVMAAMLQAARADGVFPCANFLWLKPVDRGMWFMLNSIGRQTVYTEVAGPFAHWLAEKALGRRIMVPMIDEAVRGLETAIKEVKYVPDDEFAES